MPLPIRVLIVPGLRDSGPDHWQTWLESRCRYTLRVQQRDWARPDLDAWAARIEATLAERRPARWIAVAHSFGALAVVEAIARQPWGIGERPGIRAALLVAPADPAKFGLQHRLAQRALRVPATLVASRSDPWLGHGDALRWAARWNASLVDLGDAGHVNVASGHRTLPLALDFVERQTRALAVSAAFPSDARSAAGSSRTPASRPAAR